MRATHLGVVISHWKVTQPWMGLMGSRSTPILMEALGMYLAATCNLNKKSSFVSKMIAFKVVVIDSWLFVRKRYLPSTGCRTEIDDALSASQEVVLLVELDQLEGSTGPVAVLLSHVIELIKTPLGVLFLTSWHSFI